MGIHYKKPVIALALLPFFLFISLSLSGQTWIGGTPSNETDWSTASNWNPATIPGPGGMVIISPATFNPIMGLDVGTVANILVQAGGRLQVASGGQVTLSSAISDGVTVLPTGEFLIDLGGRLDIANTQMNFNAINNFGKFTNRGAIQIANSFRPVNNDGAPAEFHNYGDMFLGAYERDGIRNYNDALFYNHQTGNIIASISGDCGLEGQAAAFINDGNFTINTTNDGILLGRTASFVNNGVLNIQGIIGMINAEDDGIELIEDAAFINNGQVIINNMDDGLDLLTTEPVVNTGTITITQSTGRSIDIARGSALTNSGQCGLISMEGNLENSGLIQNDAYLQMGNALTNILSTINNSPTGYICDPNNLFASQLGTFNNTGTLAITNCASPPGCGVFPGAVAAVPTLSEWALFILALLLVSVGTVSLMQDRPAVSTPSNGNISLSGGQIPFHKKAFIRSMILALVLGGLFFVWGPFVCGPLGLGDVVGCGLSVPLVAYLLHLIQRNSD